VVKFQAQQFKEELEDLKNKARNNEDSYEHLLVEK
jgi:hypothetical protein